MTFKKSSSKNYRKQYSHFSKRSFQLIGLVSKSIFEVKVLIEFVKTLLFNVRIQGLPEKLCKNESSNKLKKENFACFENKTERESWSV